MNSEKMKDSIIFMQETVDYLRKSNEETIKNYIRQHRIGQFKMSGYDDETGRGSDLVGVGQNTIHNQNVLNSFANLGIYDYTEFLFLDFYKGNPTLYMKYWNGQYFTESFGGYSTTEIIYEIFKLTILSESDITYGYRRRDDVFDLDLSYIRNKKINNLLNK